MNQNDGGNGIFRARAFGQAHVAEYFRIADGLNEIRLDLASVERFISFGSGRLPQRRGKFYAFGRVVLPVLFHLRPLRIVRERILGRSRAFIGTADHHTHRRQQSDRKRRPLFDSFHRILLFL